MSERAEEERAFLAFAGWSDARAVPLAGDASARRYTRLISDRSRAILMDEPGDVRPFLAIGRWLRTLGLSAPLVLAADEAHGFLLLEDLGDGLLARLAGGGPGVEASLYLEAVQVLLRLRDSAPPGGLTVYDADMMSEFAALAAETWGRTDPGALAKALRPHFAPLATDYTVALRDYHAENLLWLPDRAGLARIGLLDYQDALLAHPVYDLVSLLQDVRRDVGSEAVAAATRLWREATGADAEALARDIALCGVQRQLRILGVFARLATSGGKPHYLDLAPRVWRHLTRCLETPGLEKLEELVLDALPPATPEYIAALRSGA